jgi:hypothetical protein
MHSFTNIAYAAAGNVDQLIANINKYIVNPFIGFLFVLATILFLVGVARYYLAGSPEDRSIGHKHMIWGLTGMFIMISVFGIMKIIINTFGINLSEFGASIPQ